MRRVSTWIIVTSIGVGACGSSDDDGSTKPGTGGNATGGSAGSATGGGGTSSDAGSDASAGGTTSTLTSTLEADGFEVQNGRFDLLDLASCCDVGKTCSGNNPTSPYAAVFVPPAPGQTAANPSPSSDGTSVSYRLRVDEAIVLFGKTPPKAKYFGLTPYLMDKQGAVGQRVPIFASLSETLNNGVIAVEGGGEPFDKPTLVIASADSEIDARVRQAAIGAGYAESAINSLVFDPTLSKFGLDDAADTFGILFRVAIFADSTAGKTWLDAPPVSVLRVTPKSIAPSTPFAKPPARAKDLLNNESALAASVDALEQAIVVANSGYTGSTLFVTKNELDPSQCIQNGSFCAGDNRDTTYPAILPRKFFDSPDDFYVVFGVNHAATEKTSYSSASIYAVDHLVGVKSVNSDQYAGSADALLPGNADASKLYAWKIARSCGSDPHCTEIPDADCPTGIGAGKFGFIAFRTYLEPTTNTAPDLSTLVVDRVLRFTKP